METLVLGLAIAYLVGSIPTAYLAGRVRGVDVGSAGSGNYGATNVFRTLGAAPAIAVVLVDVAKGLLPVLLIPRLLPAPSLGPMTYAVLVAVATILGHVFSIFLGFRGGKGVGTAFGAYLAMAPWPILIAAGAWLAVVLVARIVSLGSLVAGLVLLVAVAAWDPPQGGDAALVGVTAALVAFVFWTHRENIRRLLSGEERPIRAPGGRKGDA